LLARDAFFLNPRSFQRPCFQPSLFIRLAPMCSTATNSAPENALVPYRRSHVSCVELPLHLRVFSSSGMNRTIRDRRPVPTPLLENPLPTYKVFPVGVPIRTNDPYIENPNSCELRSFPKCGAPLPAAYPYCQPLPLFRFAPTL